MKTFIAVLLLSTFVLTNYASAQTGSDGSTTNTMEDTNHGGDDNGEWGLLGLLGLAGLLGLRKNKDHNHVNSGHRN